MPSDPVWFAVRFQTPFCLKAVPLAAVSSALNGAGSSNSLLVICFARGLQVCFFVLRRLKVSHDGYLSAHLMRGDLSRLRERQCLDTSSLNRSGSYGHQLPFIFFPLGRIMHGLGVFRALLCGTA